MQISSLFCPLTVLLRLLESSMINAEMKEGEILPPTIQKLMKGYNKYLRPFFESKETTFSCTNDPFTAGMTILYELIMCKIVSTIRIVK